MPPGYPERWETDVALTDGGVAESPSGPADPAAAVAAFHARQPPDDHPLPLLQPPCPPSRPAWVDRLTNVDYVDRMGFVAELGYDIIGMAAYDLWPERDHRRGVGS